MSERIKENDHSQKASQIDHRIAVRIRNGSHVKYSRVLLSGLAGAILLALLAPFLLAPEIKVERSIEVNAPARDVYELVVDLERHPAWHPWDINDPFPRLVFGEARRGTEASYFWIGARDNHGMLKLTRVDESTREIDGLLDLSSLGESNIAFRFKETASGVEVTETFRKHTGRNLFKRYLHPLYRAAAGRQIEKHLQRLKAAGEGHPLVPSASTDGG